MIQSKFTIIKPLKENSLGFNHLKQIHSDTKSLTKNYQLKLN